MRVTFIIKCALRLLSLRAVAILFQFVPIVVKLENSLYDPKAPDWEQFALPEYDPAEEITDEELGIKPRLSFVDRLRRPFGSGF